MQKARSDPGLFVCEVGKRGFLQAIFPQASHARRWLEPRRVALYLARAEMKSPVGIPALPIQGSLRSLLRPTASTPCFGAGADVGFPPSAGP
jgi:hypothetical protein